MSDSDTQTSMPVATKSKFSKKMIPTRALIEMVRARPCLWDRGSAGYRDKLEKDKAWHEIYQQFEPSFDSLNQARKNFIGSTITRKWHNARDSYVKSRKGGMRLRPYLYSDELRFLDGTLKLRRSRDQTHFMDEGDEPEQDATQTWMSEVFVDIEEEEPNNDMPTKTPKMEFEATTFEGSPKESPHTPKEDFDENIVSVLINLIQKEEDEDRAFFKSITPAVKKLSEDSKFEFRIQVMKLINSLKLKDANGVSRQTHARTSNGDSDSDA